MAPLWLTVLRHKQRLQGLLATFTSRKMASRKTRCSHGDAKRRSRCCASGDRTTTEVHHTATQLPTVVQVLIRIAGPHVLIIAALGLVPMRIRMGARVKLWMGV